MKLLQLIEIAHLPDSIWLTFWDLREKTRTSVEIRRPGHDYRLGELFWCDAEAKSEGEVLQAIARATDEMLGLAVLPLPGLAGEIEAPADQSARGRDNMDTFVRGMLKVAPSRLKRTVERKIVFWGKKPAAVTPSSHPDDSRSVVISIVGK